MAPILEVKGLKKEFKGFALKNISFTLERGYIMGFIGPNGAGKSTTIKLIMNLLKKDGGEIKVFGLDNIKHEKEIKNRIGFVFDENYFYEELTVAEMKRVIAPLYKNWDDGAFNRYLKEFSLPPDKKIKELSKGMKMKFSLAVALSHNAELLIMDEPTSGLDPIIRSELLDILTSVIQDENKGVFFSTHITSDLDKIADYITFINDGRIIFSCPKDDIFEKYALVRGPKEILNTSIRQHFIGIKENRFGFEGLVKDKHQLNKMFKDGIVIDKPSLDDIMLYFTRRVQNV
ncbi:ABC transporter ATP-binding protein [Caldicoprobacter faecalis]|uniref:ABC-2 type transport system ATP-binding protein n=1 Tax=Caldicoprobacter faecalis TaxID=937334 RepID=A0A1I5XVZ4_9FIRM|nr:ABC transporter ATP-binding protein [Caldicoprobacter faecalis]SFQ36074.1 ABC-2 type transport system ATP-binding protein [Caldicoprobacter faecalis]